MYKLNVDVLLLEELFKKQNKRIKDQGEKLIKSNEEHGKQLAETNAVVKKMTLIIVIVKKRVHCFLDKKKYLMKLVIKDFLKTEDSSNKVDLINLIYRYKFGSEVTFDEIINPLIFMIKEGNSNITLEEAK